MGDVVAAADEEAGDGDSVGDVEEDDAGDDHAKGGEGEVSVAFVERGDYRGLEV